jgi:fermentation-respiration switch protein FrsA (DUF1100 family)
MIVLMYVGIILAAIIVIFMIELLIAGLYPGVSVPKQSLKRTSGFTQEKIAGGTARREEVAFDVKGVAVRAWLFLPESVSSHVPCVVMAHGMGGIKNMGLDAYAGRFQEAGLAVLAFDYRYNGESAGEPRQLIWIPSQLEDYAGAIDYVRGLKEIDPARIALWGTSLSGGHVIVSAARDKRIACIAAQCPLLDGTETAEEHVKHMGIKYVLRMAGHGQRDIVRSWLKLSPHRVPIVGKAGTIALMANDEAWNTFLAMAPDNYVNEACARIAIRMDKYRPINQLGQVTCPVLLQVGDKDMAVPAKVINKAQKLLGQHGKVIRYPINHFDIYLGDNFERAVNDQVAFFSKHL